MKIKLLASIALLGLSVGSAQAITLNFSDSHTADGEVDQFKFNVNGTGSVSFWTDTLQDGFDSVGALFKLNSGTGKYDFVQDIANGTQIKDPVTALNTTGLNVYGIAMKNGYIQDDPLARGVSDTGMDVDLDTGSYLLTIAGFDYMPNASLNGGGTLDDGFIDSNLVFVGEVLAERLWSSWAYNTSGVASPYDLFIKGDVSELSASPVPVPAAVWLFASAIAGLGATGRGRKQK